jgi:hypothetical protein
MGAIGAQSKDISLTGILGHTLNQTVLDARPHAAGFRGGFGRRDELGRAARNRQNCL